MRSTQELKKDHVILRRVRDIALKSSNLLYKNYPIPIEDVEIICLVIEEFIDNFHHGKEEVAYFPGTKDKNDNADAVRKFLIEHEFGRRIAKMLRNSTINWRKSKNTSDADLEPIKNPVEPVARFLRTYAIFIDDHTGKEDKFFDEIEILEEISPELDLILMRQYDSCRAKIGGEQRIEQMLKLIDYLEARDWIKL